MRNLLYQFKRAVGHVKSILMKLMNKITKGATTSVQVLGEAIVIFVALPIATVLLGVSIIVGTLYMVLGGVPIDNEAVETYHLEQAEA